MGRYWLFGLVIVGAIYSWVNPPRLQPIQSAPGTSRGQLGDRVYYEHGQTGPVMIVLHGGASSPLAMERLTGLSACPLRVIYPQGIGGNWNDGRTDPNSAAYRQRVDDLGFIQQLNSRFGPAYLLGFSNGALMAGHYAALHPRGLKGVICVRGALAQGEQPFSAAGLPVLLLQGPQDPLVPYDGGELWGNRGSVLGARESADVWRRAGAQVILEELPGRQHDWTPEITRRVARFLGI